MNQDDTSFMNDQAGNEESPVLLCDACGLPPSSEGLLKSCTRCRQARYHNRTCQKNHYPQHKAFCLQHAQAQSQNGTKINKGVNKETSCLFKCEARGDRGRCMVASQSLERGIRVSLSDPFVPGLLEPTERSRRCCYCFSLVPPHFLPSSTTKNKPLHMHCGPTCRKKDLFYEWEEQVCQRAIACGASGPPSLSILFATRIIRHLCRTNNDSSKISELTSNVDKLSKEEAGEFHEMAQICLQMFHLVPCQDVMGMGRDDVSEDVAFEIIAQISNNSFAVQGGVDGEAVGAALYPSVSMANHSCRANAVQTFFCREKMLPQIAITTYRPIQKDEELTISYIETGAPTAMRNKQLWKQYKFRCLCEKCVDIDLDDQIIGVRCLKGACSGIGKRARQRGHGPRNEQEQNICKCSLCDNTSFGESLNKRQDALDRSDALEAAKGMDFGKRLDEWRNIVKLLKTCCTRESWYICVAAEKFVETALDATDIMSSVDQDDADRRRVCSQALDMLVDTVSPALLATASSENDLAVLGFELRRARLELFLMADPVPALKRLARVESEYQLYYPPDAEIMQSIHALRRPFMRS
jgi:hypothetical protein